MKITVLGSGTSTGVPRIGNDWGECDPEEPRNRRTRVSLMVESGTGQRVLIDTSTDCRAQMLANGVDRIDAVLWTHDHADHCHGIDDLRPFRYGRGGPIPGYASAETVRRLRARFGYVFAGQFGYSTIVELDTIDRLRMVAGMGLMHCQMPHGPAQSTAYRLEDGRHAVGYATDFSAITDEMVSVLGGCDALVVDCLRREPHPTHAHLAMALELIQRTGARRGILTHLDKSMDYQTLLREVPSGVEPAFDGMELLL